MSPHAKVADATTIGPANEKKNDIAGACQMLQINWEIVFVI